ncbi:MAG: XrtA-associated ATPase, partial [Gammaproteobacteria bacterium]|nr:XrtA-associated ATPase [Gammaproteobacteria bacterium]
MYEEFYGFKSVPFRLSPDPAFFFGSQGHKRALAYLRYGLNQKEGFIVITGAPGTGKTTLARALLQETSRDKIVVAELNTTHLDADDVLRMVAASFGLEHENLPKATLLKRLESFFISRARAGYHVLLLVDEAQNLPHNSLEELRMLSNFYLGKDALIQIFLLGQEQFRNNLYSNELEQLRQRVVASSHLEPLNQQETREYIEHRLKLAGWSGNPLISDRAYVRLFALTKGVPRRINTFCERLLLYGALEELTEIHDENIKTVAKELMYEISAKGVKLSDINPGVPDVDVAQVENESERFGTEAQKAAEEALEAIDSEMLSSFSDDVTEAVEKKPVTTSISQVEVADEADEDSVFEDTTDIVEESEGDAKDVSFENESKENESTDNERLKNTGSDKLLSAGKADRNTEDKPAETSKDQSKEQS